MNRTESASGDLVTQSCTLCIVGAGIAGLNALFVASEYLSKKDRVILIDSKPAFGGMWIETYDYVRLHQPHPMFTAGNIPWTLDEPPSYLATKPEILDHFSRCMAELESRVDLVQYYGYRYESHNELVRSSGVEAHVLCNPVDGDKEPLLIQATTLIKAVGFRITKSEPLVFSSTRVNSISPNDDVLGDQIAQSAKPVYVIGGGKTGMDTAHALISHFPEKEVNLVVGEGTVFLNRDKAFPAGLKRWWAGHTGLHIFLDIALRFDGDNEQEAFDYFRKSYGVSLEQDYGNYVFGVLSSAENRVISKGTNAVIKDYVDDVVDMDGRPRIIFRSGSMREIDPDSWFVNCTGYVLRDEHPYEPFLSPDGAVVSVQPTSGIHILTTFASYFLVHLYYLGKLGDVPLYELDHQALIKLDKTIFPLACVAQIIHNIIVIIDAVPMSVMAECGLDFDRWFPSYRRIYGALKLKRNRERYLTHLRKALDRIHERFEVKSGLLEQPDRLRSEFRSTAAG